MLNRFLFLKDIEKSEKYMRLKKYKKNARFLENERALKFCL